MGVEEGTGDPWADEGFGGEDEWGEESLASDLEESAPGGDEPPENDAEDEPA